MSHGRLEVADVRCRGGRPWTTRWNAVGTADWIPGVERKAGIMNAEKRQGEQGQKMCVSVEADESGQDDGEGEIPGCHRLVVQGWSRA